MFKAGKVAIGILVIGYVGLALYPFTWSPPERIDNAATRTSRDTLVFDSTGFLYAPPDPAWLSTIIEDGSLHLLLRIRSFSPDQYGPARIFTISKDTRTRNLTVGQQGSDLVLRLRTVRTDLNGKPEYVIPGVFDDEAWHELELTVHAGTLLLDVDGKPRVQERVPEAPFRNWDESLQLGFGNEFTWDRPWRGEIAKAEIQGTDCLADCELVRPGGHLVDNRFTLIGSLPDVLVNFIGFLPLGYLTALWLKGRRKVLGTVLIWACAALFVESAQAFIGSRYPSLSDWILNVTAAWLGALLCARWCIGRASRS